MRLSLHEGVWSSAIAFLIAGVGVLTAVTATQPSVLYFAYTQIALGISMFGWGIRWDGQPWWRPALQRIIDGKLPPTLYLRNTDITALPGQKVFEIRWIEETVDLSFRGEGYGNMHTPQICERNLTFEVLNAGDEIRHLVACWRLPNVDLDDMVKVLGPNVQSFKDRKLSLKGKSCATIYYASTNIEGPTLPFIGKGASVPLESPNQFTNAYSICALALARRKFEKDRGSNLTDPIEILEKWKIQMPTAFIDVSYVQGNRRCKQSFAVWAELWGGAMPHVQQKNQKTRVLEYALAPGIIAVVDHVTPVSAEDYFRKFPLSGKSSATAVDSEPTNDPQPAKKAWHEDRTRMTIREAGCWAAGDSPKNFEANDDAQSKASELRYYVERGFVPIAGMNAVDQQLRQMSRDVGGIAKDLPPVTLDTYLRKRDIESFRRNPAARTWWPIIDDLQAKQK
jgi:hypothetical protein